MTIRVEILGEIEIGTNGPSEAEAIRIARHKLARVAEVGHSIATTNPLPARPRARHSHYQPNRKTKNEDEDQ